MNKKDIQLIQEAYEGLKDLRKKKAHYRTKLRDKADPKSEERLKAIYKTIAQKKDQVKEALMTPDPDPEIETVFDMVLGDYLGAVGQEWDDVLRQRFINGIKKLADLANIDVKKYDVDNLIG